MRRYGLWKFDLPPPGKCLHQLLLGSTHKLSHYPASELTCLVPGNLEQNAQASHNCSSSNSLWLGDQACHNSDSSDSLRQYDQFSRNYSILVSHYSHLDVASCTYYIMVIAQNFVEPVYLPRTILVYFDSLAHSSFYLLSEASHRVYQACFDY